MEFKSINDVPKDFKYEFAVTDYYLDTVGDVNVHDKERFNVFVSFDEKYRVDDDWSDELNDYVDPFLEDCVCGYYPGVSEIMETFGIGAEDMDSSFSGFKNGKTIEEIIKVFTDYGWTYKRELLADYE